MSERTINVDISSKTSNPYNWIPIINKQSPLTNYTITENEARQLIQLSDLWIYISGTKTILSGNNFYDYFPNSEGGSIDTSQYAHSLMLEINSENYVVSACLKNSNGEQIGETQSIDLPLESMVVGGSYDDATKKVVLTLKNGNTVEFSVADLVSGLQTEITSENKLDVELIDDSNSTTQKFVTADEKTKIANALTEEVYNAGKTTPAGTKYTINGTTYTVGTNAEVFNDYSGNKAIGDFSHAEGADTTASGDFSHAEGSGTKATADCSHAEGGSTTASSSCSHAEGSSTTASGGCSHAEGSSTTASGNYSHAEGENTHASGTGSHAEGSSTTASAYYSHAEGYNTTVNGALSHAEGNNTTASGVGSHAEGIYTIAQGDYQHVQGKYNVKDTRYAFIIGNGTGDSTRSNAFAVDWNGLIYVNNAATGVNVSQLQPTISSSNKLNANLVDDSSSTNKFVTSTEKTKIANSITATDYATQTTGGTVKVWTTTENGETTLHIATE